MASTLKRKILRNIETVFTQSEKSRLGNDLFENLENEFTFLSEYFHITKPQALFFSIVFSMHYDGRKVEWRDLSRHFDVTPMKLLQYSENFDVLIEKRLFRRKAVSRWGRRLKLTGANQEFYINEIVSDKILKGETIPEDLVDVIKFKDIFSLLEKISDLADQRGEEEISTNELFEQTESILEENEHFLIVEKIKSTGFSIKDKFLFFYVLWKFLEGDKRIRIEWVMRTIYDKSNTRFLELQNILEEQNRLIQENWLKIEEAGFFDDAVIRLTDITMEVLTECGIKLFNKTSNKAQRDNILVSEDIPFRKLIFSEEETSQLKLLENLLKPENFKATQDRLVQKAMPKGVTALLHGFPGTGKTESVLQMAKATNREIIKVDISSSRSKWFGESERIIKKVFKDYKSYAKEQKLTPILFFNEADAIIAQRKEDSNSNTGSTENRIQNILLEEIENFEGILIATTNLVMNMDTAFERRFLFKIKFDKPGVSAKTQIWKSKMPTLSLEDCKLLAVKFDFSGGQIDNIIRKAEINEIIHNIKPDLNRIIEFCKEEGFNEQGRNVGIGFRFKNISTNEIN